VSAAAIEGAAPAAPSHPNHAILAILETWRDAIDPAGSKLDLTLNAEQRATLAAVLGLAYNELALLNVPIEGVIAISAQLRELAATIDRAVHSACAV